MSKIELVRERVKVTDRSIKSFAGAVVGDIASWEQGDELEFPDALINNAFETKINGRSAQYILVKVNGNDEDIRQWFPSIARRRVRIAEEGETINGVIQAILTDNYEVMTGTVIDTYKSCATVDEFVKMCLGKKMKYSLVKEVPTNRFGTMELTTGKVYQLDWVE